MKFKTSIILTVVLGIAWLVVLSATILIGGFYTKIEATGFDPKALVFVLTVFSFMLPFGFVGIWAGYSFNRGGE